MAPNTCNVIHSGSSNTNMWCQIETGPLSADSGNYKDLMNKLSINDSGKMYEKSCSEVGMEDSEGEAIVIQSNQQFNTMRTPASNKDSSEVEPIRLDVAAINSDLEKISSQLKDKSDELLVSNISQVKNYFKRIKHYIKFVSKPSNCVKECRVKQEIAGKIMSLLLTEEARVSLKMIPKDKSVKGNRITCPMINDSGLSILDKHSDILPTQNEKFLLTNSDKNILSEIGDLNLDQLPLSSRVSSKMYDWQLKSTYSEEVCEKLKHDDSANVSKNQFNLAMKLREKKTEHISKLKKEIRKIDKYDDLLNAVLCGKVSSLSLEDGVTSLTKQSLNEIVSEKNGSNVLEKIERRDVDDANVDESSINSKTLDEKSLRSSSIKGKKSSIKGTTKNIKSPHNIKSSLKLVKCNKKISVAYYLPLDTMAPIRIGRRILREEAGDNESAFLGENNRELLSKYTAALDFDCSRESKEQFKMQQGQSRSETTCKLNLQEAVKVKMKKFIKNCEARQLALKRSKEARILRMVKQDAWIKKVASQSPRSQRIAEPTYTPVPQLRVFSYKDMVRDTRARYEKLPEVQNKKMSLGISNRNQRHRLLAYIYSNRLQKRVVKGKVSLTHNQRVV